LTKLHEREPVGQASTFAAQCSPQKQESTVAGWSGLQSQTGLVNGDEKFWQSSWMKRHCPPFKHKLPVLAKSWASQSRPTGATVVVVMLMVVVVELMVVVVDVVSVHTRSEVFVGAWISTWVVTLQGAEISKHNRSEIVVGGTAS
jgi:hypothetical protein